VQVSSGICSLLEVSADGSLRTQKASGALKETRFTFSSMEEREPAPDIRWAKQLVRNKMLPCAPQRALNHFPVLRANQQTTGDCQ
jgi:hypothetical protein